MALWLPSAAAGLLHGVSFGLSCLAPALGQKMFFLSGMATSRALLEPRGDGYLPGYAVLKDEHDAISFVPIPSFWVSGSPCLVGRQDDRFCWELSAQGHCKSWQLDRGNQKGELISAWAIKNDPPYPQPCQRDWQSV